MTVGGEAGTNVQFCEELFWEEYVLVSCELTDVDVKEVVEALETKVVVALEGETEL